MESVFMDELPQLLNEADIRKLIVSSIQARRLQALSEPTEDELKELCLWVHRMSYWALLIKAALSGKMLIDIKPEGGEVRFMVNPADESSDPRSNPLVGEIEEILQGYDWGSDFEG